MKILYNETVNKSAHGDAIIQVNKQSHHIQIHKYNIFKRAYDNGNYQTFPANWTELNY